MSADAFDKFFRDKYEYLNEFIHTFEGASKMLGDDRIEKHLLTVSSALLRNIKDLYYMHEVSTKMLLQIRDDLNKLKQRTGQTEHMATQLSEQMNSTLGSLEERLKKINELDAQESKDLKETNFYG